MPLGDALDVASISMPPLEIALAGLQVQAGEEPRRRRCAAPQDPCTAVAAAIVRAVLDADQSGFGAAEIAPLRDARHNVILDRDLPEEVVRGEEREVPAQVAVLGDDVVLARRHVLVMAGEDDQRVCVGQRLAVADVAQLRVGQVVDVAVRLGEPADERRVVLLPVRRHPAVEERPDQARLQLLPAGVPRVGLAIAVVVAEVVRLPRLGRHDDGDPVLAEVARSQDEWGVADARARCGQLREVDAARPVGDRDRQSAPPVHRSDRGDRRDGGAKHDVVRNGRLGLAARAEDLHGHLRGRVCDDELGPGAGAIALLLEVAGQLRLLRVGDVAREAHQADLVRVELAAEPVGVGGSVLCGGRDERGEQGHDGDRGAAAGACVGSHAATVEGGPNAAGMNA